MGIVWTIIIGFIAGVVAKFIMPGPNEPRGFILTTILGRVQQVRMYFDVYGFMAQLGLIPAEA